MQGPTGQCDSIPCDAVSIRKDSIEVHVLAVIPARYGATRLPGKPLAEIAGKPMIQHVWVTTFRVSPLRQPEAAVVVSVFSAVRSLTLPDF